jgi:hypothetical protein
MTTATSGNGGGGDDFIPAPDGEAATATDAPADTGTILENAGDLPPVEINTGIGQTELILALVALLALAGLLFILKNVIRKSLISGRATIDSANAAGWSWYLTLLGFGALVIAGIAGDLFSSVEYIGLTVAVLVVGLLISMKMTSRAKRTA